MSVVNYHIISKQVELFSWKTTCYNDHLELCLPNTRLLSGLFWMWYFMKITQLERKIFYQAILKPWSCKRSETLLKSLLFWLAGEVSWLAVDTLSISKIKVRISETKFRSFYKTLIKTGNKKVVFL